MDHNTFSGIRIDFTQPLPSASFSELTAATHAFRKAAPIILIHSDCKAGISAVHKAAGARASFVEVPKVPKSICNKLLPPQLTCINGRKVDRNSRAFAHCVCICARIASRNLFRSARAFAYANFQKCARIRVRKIPKVRAHNASAKLRKTREWITAARPSEVASRKRATEFFAINLSTLKVAGEEFTDTVFDDRALHNTTIIDGDHLIQNVFLADWFVICSLASPATARLQGIGEVVQTVRVATYKRVRDKQRIPRPAIQQVVTHEWAASMYDLGASTTVMSRATCVRILLDKHMHGRELDKNPLFKDNTTCPLCDGEDSQYHVIRKCSHRTMHLANLSEETHCSPVHPQARAEEAQPDHTAVRGLPGVCVHTGGAKDERPHCLSWYACSLTPGCA